MLTNQRSHFGYYKTVCHTELILIFIDNLIKRRNLKMARSLTQKLEYLPEKADPLVSFDCTSMINSSLPPQPQPPAMTRQDTEIIHYCPIHYLSPMRKGKTTTSLGEWEFPRCSETKFFNNCFVACGLDRAEYYLEDPNNIGI